VGRNTGLEGSREQESKKVRSRGVESKKASE
jgi:hypothetical protein